VAKGKGETKDESTLYSVLSTDTRYWKAKPKSYYEPHSTNSVPKKSR
jgi:hypothetical protein